MKELAEICHISESRLFHLFKQHMKMTPVTFKNNIRIQYAINYLQDTDMPIELICEQLNFNSAGYFRKVFKEFTGFNPGQYRKISYEQRDEKSQSTSKGTQKPLNQFVSVV